MEASSTPVPRDRFTPVLLTFLLIMVALCNRADHTYFHPVSFMVALWNRETIYIFMLWFVLSSFFLFFPRLISAVGDWMFTILWHMVWP